MKVIVDARWEEPVIPCTSRWILAVHKETETTKVFKEICNGSGDIYYADLKEVRTQERFERDWIWYTIIATESYEGDG